jgi:hypothetical protein
VLDTDSEFFKAMQGGPVGAGAAALMARAG